MSCIHRHSVAMFQHLHVLRSFIRAGKVTIVSLNAPKKSFEGAAAGTDGIDDVAGVEGVQLKDDFASVMFENQCLYFSKGVADHVILMKASDLMVPAALIGDRSDVNELITRATTLSLLSAPYAGPTSYGLAAAKNGRRLDVAASSEKPHGSAAGSRGGRLRHAPVTSAGVAAASSSSHASSGGGSTTGHGQPHLRIGNRHRYNASHATSGRETTEPVGVCSLLVPQYGIADPNSLFASWGPGDDYWTRGKLMPSIMGL